MKAHNWDLNDLSSAYEHADELLIEYYGVTLEWFENLMEHAMINDRKARILLLSILGYEPNEIARNFGVGKVRIQQCLHEAKYSVIKYFSHPYREYSKLNTQIKKWREQRQKNFRRRYGI